MLYALQLVNQMKAILAQLLVACRREHVEPDPPELEGGSQRVVAVAAGAGVKVEQVPVVVLQLLHVDVDPRDLVPVVVRRLQIRVHSESEL